MDSLALVEPMSMDELIAQPDTKSRVNHIQEYFNSIRLQVADNGTAPKKLLADGEASNTFKSATGTKRGTSIVAQVDAPLQSALTEQFTLVVKHPNAFTALLFELRNHFDCYAIIRNPIAVLASWSTLDHPLAGGNAPVAEALDEELRSKLALHSIGIERQLVLLDWYYSVYFDCLEKRNVVKYEEIVSSAGAALDSVSGKAHQVPLSSWIENRNNSSYYNYTEMKSAADVLLENTSHSAWRFYSKQDVISVLG